MLQHRPEWFLLLSASHLVKFDTSDLPCVYALFRLISIARYARICFSGTKYEIKREHVTAFYIVRRAWLWLELFASTIGSSLYYHRYHICSRTISLETPQLYREKATRLFSEGLVFLAAIRSSLWLCFSCSIYLVVLTLASYADALWARHAIFLRDELKERLRRSLF